MRVSQITTTSTIHRPLFQTAACRAPKNHVCSWSCFQQTVTRACLLWWRYVAMATMATSPEFPLSIFWGGAWTGPPAFYYGCPLSPPPLVHLLSDTLPAPEAILLKKRARLCPVTALMFCGLKATLPLGARPVRRPPTGQQPRPRALFPGRPLSGPRCYRRGLPSEERPTRWSYVCGGSYKTFAVLMFL